MMISRAWLLTCGLLRSSVLVRGTIACQGRIENWGLEDAAFPLTPPPLPCGEGGPVSQFLSRIAVADGTHDCAVGSKLLRLAQPRSGQEPCRQIQSAAAARLSTRRAGV